jgi:hypothetical protein
MERRRDRAAAAVAGLDGQLGSQGFGAWDGPIGRCRQAVSTNRSKFFSSDEQLAEGAALDKVATPTANSAENKARPSRYRGVWNMLKNDREHPWQVRFW